MVLAQPTDGGAAFGGHLWEPAAGRVSDPFMFEARQRARGLNPAGRGARSRNATAAGGGRFDDVCERWIRDFRQACGTEYP